MLLDVNTLIALLWDIHVHHERAQAWFSRLRSFVTCPIVQLGFVRISLFSDPRHRFVPDDVSCDDRVLLSEDIASFSAVTDHYLVALARQHKLVLATFDAPLHSAFRHERGLVELIP